MKISQIASTDALDLFNLPAQTSFKMEAVDIDIFGKEKEKEDVKEKEGDDNKEGGEVNDGKKTDVDLFEIQDTEKEGEGEVSDFSILNTLIEKGELMGIVDEEDKPYELKSIDDVIELLKLNKEEVRNEVLQNAEKQILESKSPTWKALLDYSQYYENPSDIIPLLQGVQNFQTVSSLDEKTEEGAEEIYRIHLTLKGETNDVIADMVTMAKENKKLEYFAEKFKPQLLKNEAERIENEAKLKEDAYKANLKIINDNHLKTVEVLEKPLFGNVNLSQQEKMVAYQTVASPTKEGGYALYHKIDNLYKEGKFDKLVEIALLLENENYHNYVSSKAVEKSGEEIQKKLRLGSSTKVKSSEQLPDKIEKTPIRKNSEGGGFSLKRYS